MQPSITLKNKLITIDQTRVVEAALARTTLLSDYESGVALSVVDIAGFGVGKYVVIEPFGPNAEVVAVHASTAPTGNTITLAATPAFDHPAGAEVVYVKYNQVEISHADTEGGAKTALATLAVLAREEKIVYQDTTETAGYYFARFKDSIATLYSAYSDPLPYAGWGDTQVGSMIAATLSDLGLDYNGQVDVEACLRWLNEGLEEVQGKQSTWTEHMVYNEVIGQLGLGDKVIAMPEGAYHQNNNLSLQAVRVGAGTALRYLEPDRFDAQLEGLAQTAVRTEAAVGATSLAVQNSYDFTADGLLTVYVGGNVYTITYTGVTRDNAAGGTAVFTGIPASGVGSISAILPVGTYVYQGESEGRPVLYTVRNNQIEFWPMAAIDYENVNVYADYNTTVTKVSSESDTIDFHRYNMLLNYLRWRVWCRTKNDGVLEMNNGYYMNYREQLNDAIRNRKHVKMQTSPNINRMSRR